MVHCLLLCDISLGYYDIIDLTPGTNSDFINSLSKSEYEELKGFNPPKLPNVNCDEIKELIVKWSRYLIILLLSLNV